ncbi:MAG TPA: PQQ-binding-like beta-propeller repeat protein, partial [Vicinamibacterales bacterium]|nr:PQQ-binding-like beta-propeller repeat protein [Vicinamibacterales bacterium]
MKRFVAAFGLAVGLAWSGSHVAGQEGTVPASLMAKRGEWRSYGADLANTRYSPLDQINASNFSKLELAWRFKTDFLGPRPEFKLEGTPLMVNGRLFATAGTRRAVVALDPETGEMLWMHSELEGARGEASPRKLSGRGLSYWSDGTNERILYVTIGFRLVALDAKTGARISSFGKDGLVDLKEPAVIGAGDPIDPVKGEIGLHATPLVAGNVVIVGGTFSENSGTLPSTHNNIKGLVQAYDVRTGKRLWIFRTIPMPGEFGNDSWEKDSWAVNGNNGVWTQMAIDDQLGLVYLPVETPTSDYYGGHRPGNNLFAESIVAVDMKTGQRKWHYQLVHHPIWGFDIASPPILGDVMVNGKAVKVIAQPGKQSFLYVLDRATGKPVWPIEERAVEQSDVPGEKTSPTQPFPTRPPAYDRQGSSIDYLIDFTPELHAEAVQLVSKYKLGPIFTPPVVAKAEGPRGTLALSAGSGGSNWPGGAFDPETHTLYISSQSGAFYLWDLIPPKKDSDMRYIKGNPMSGEGQGGLAMLNVQGLPLPKPPYGRISAIDLDRGDISWQIPHGETPDNVRNHAALKGMTIPRTGQPCAGLVGMVLT